MQPQRGDRRKVLVLGLGNEIMGDDALGLLAVREVKRRVEAAIDVVEASIAGFALLDLMEGYDSVLIIDSVATGSSPPGSIVELSPSEFKQKSTLSPHFVGLNDVIELAEKLEIQFPVSIRILGMEVDDPFILREGLSDAIAGRVNDIVAKAEEILLGWGIGRPCNVDFPEVS